MGGFKILAFQDPEFNILENFKIFVNSYNEGQKC